MNLDSSGGWMLLAAASAVAICWPPLVHAIGWRGLLGAGVIAATALGPRMLFRPAVERYVGIAPPVPIPSTYMVVLALWCCSIPGSLSLLRGQWLRWMPFVTYCALLAAAYWPRTEMVESGLVQLMLAPLAWLLGAAIAREGRASALATISALATGTLMLQLGASALQALGFVEYRLEAGHGEPLDSRFGGLLDHPNNLGKVVFLLFILQASLMPSLTSGLRRLAYLSMMAGGMVAALTGGRAIMVAYGLGVLFWVALGPQFSGGAPRLVKLVMVTLAVTVSFAGVLLARLEEDPSGGARSELEALAVLVLGEIPPWGVGANRYVDHVGQLDALTASGVPVHNAFLLMAVELGLAGMLLFWLPFALAGMRALSGLSRAETRPFSAPVAASIPGLLVILMTGWGMLGSYLLPLLAFVFAGATTRATDAPSVELPRRFFTPWHRSRVGAIRRTIPACAPRRHEVAASASSVSIKAAGAVSVRTDPSPALPLAAHGRGSAHSPGYPSRVGRGPDSGFAGLLGTLFVGILASMTVALHEYLDAAVPPLEAGAPYGTF